MVNYNYTYSSKSSRNKKIKESRVGKFISRLIFLLIICAGAYLASKNFSSIFPKTSIPLLSPTVYVYVDPLIPNEWKDKVSSAVSNSDKHETTEDSNRATISVVLQPDETAGKTCELLYQEDYFPVMRFATLDDSIPLDKLKSSVSGSSADYDYINVNGLEDKAKSILSIESVSSASSVETREALVSQLESNKSAISFVPASYLGPNLKVMEVDNVFPLDTDGMFRAETYICARDFSNPVAVALMTEEEDRFDSISLDSTATVIQTGVTAMGRNLVNKAKSTNDPAWFAQKIGDFLRDADLTHTSNEVSFVEGCTQQKGTMRFCALPSTIETLKESGITLVELTGNHNNDYGKSHSTYTIELYKEHGIDYFGGGLNLEDAKKPYVTEIKGTKIGFLGYNYYDSVVSKNSIPLASTTQPGANPYSEDQVKADIQSLREEVDIVIVDYQFQECWCYSEGNTVCYRPDAVPNQKKVFQQTAEWGADIVVGTQAHQPQGFEMGDDKAIFYGLGNLYFDQVVE